MSSFDVITTTLASAVADAGTFTVAYPTNRNAGDYEGGTDHRMNSMTYGELKSLSGDFSVSFDATVVTITNSTGAALAAATEIYVQLDRMGRDDGSVSIANTAKMVASDIFTINLGAPDTADANGYVESQNLTTAGVFSVSTTVAAALAAAALDGTADVPRNVVAAWTTTAVLTVTGTDEYGNTIVESSASGTSFAGKKAFKTITDITTSVNITGLTVGTGDVIGLPVFLPATGLVLAELEDGAAATAGTVVAGSTAVATATTGDVRGTYDANSAANGARAFQLVAVIPDAGNKGVAQYAG